MLVSVASVDMLLRRLVTRRKSQTSHSHRLYQPQLPLIPGSTPAIPSGYPMALRTEECGIPSPRSLSTIG